MSMTHQYDLTDTFPFLATLNEAAIAQFRQRIGVASIPAGQHVCREGDICPQLAVVLSGSVRVYKVGETGREITLYRIGQQDSCILTASCILSQTRFPALAVVEQDVQVALIPAANLREWVAQHEVWRTYVFNLLSRRLAEVITTLDEVAFRRVDVRLAECLLTLTQQQAQATITHQQLASELGSAREVVSRILKDFEREGLIALTRGIITVQDRAGLQKRARA
ncbi:Crp/Fnr family transcriptional regulator [Thiothrix subterranea]|uniref:Crp/Fnr family transcriptional regulator n=1 Tax=Thiothrix subterranea TaxID=2735563 RepID=A0AA51MJ62_9GAMM|nr:Crp/Fnr family transcriptional regulator [Thiothrix subterranea]MDQ5768688.1 Crp/Fnr family transcriptional regulator [Thiothrix subterranea]WML84840.1 Crp/Fnr family transcriptional regulator [Thiothrix subterranea]